MNNLPIGTIVFDGVSKRYRLGALGTLRSTVAALAQRGRGGDGPRDLWALQDVSFRVEPGDSLGLIGPNGAGKTTALKLLSNITRPTTGRIAVQGQLSTLIELGAGFHPELSGRDNIYLNGAILGLKRREIARKFDDIVAFSELERFLDTPVKRYSSGMYVRLAFAVAAHVEPDVLLVDEVLAVGDSSFRRKCMVRMEALRAGGTTLIFVSHNMYQVRRLCDRALLLMQGRSVFLGPTGEAISAYEESAQPNQQKPSNDWASKDAQTDILITEVALLDLDGNPLQRLRYDQRVQVRVHYRAHKPIVEPIVKIRLLRSDGTVCALTASHHKPSAGGWTFARDGEVLVLLDPIQLTTGVHIIEARIADSSDAELLASGQTSDFWVQGPAMMHEPNQGVFVPKAAWSHIGGQS